VARRLVIAAVGPLAAAVALASCTNDRDAAPPATLVAVTSTTEAPRAADGTLRIGLLLPDSGDGATIGEPLISAALAAAEQINAAGGVLGRRLQVVTNVDEGTSASAARDAATRLIDQDVDAVVGPASSTAALAVVPQLMRAGVLTCSPTASALALDELPDRQLFFRTIPSDSLQAVGIAEQAERTGALSALVVSLDDAFGRPLARATIEALRAHGMTVDEHIEFSADDEVLRDEAVAVDDSDAGVVVVIGDAVQGVRMITAIGEATRVEPGASAPPIIVNSAMRRPLSSQAASALPPSVRLRVTGLAPVASLGSPDEPAGPYAVNAYDCMNLIALAAAQAGTDDPEQMAAQMAEVSDGGVSCRLYAECLALVQEQRNIDYEGPDGPLQLGADGDPNRARFDRWGWNEEGVDQPLSVGPLSQVTR
jgi:branched-chain amino acid transport system substrate-binding protein